MASKNSPCVGHKTAPLLSKWIGYSWIRFNVPELMHGIFFLFILLFYFVTMSNSDLVVVVADIKNICDNLVRLMIGKTENYTWNRDDTHRRQAKRCDVFEDI